MGDTESDDWREGQKEDRQTFKQYQQWIQRVMIGGKNRERADRH
jgi:hypothetical protein